MNLSIILSFIDSNFKIPNIFQLNFITGKAAGQYQTCNTQYHFPHSHNNSLFDLAALDSIFNRRQFQYFQTAFILYCFCTKSPQVYFTPTTCNTHSFLWWFEVKQDNPF